MCGSNGSSSKGVSQQFEASSWQAGCRQSGSEPQHERLSHWTLLQLKWTNRCWRKFSGSGKSLLWVGQRFLLWLMVKLFIWPWLSLFIVLTIAWLQGTGRKPKVLTPFSPFLCWHPHQGKLSPRPPVSGGADQQWLWQRQERRQTRGAVPPLHEGEEWSTDLSTTYDPPQTGDSACR